MEEQWCAEASACHHPKRCKAGKSEADDQVPNRSLMMFPSFMNSSYSEGL
jgi:hypothetical protein